MKIRRLFCLLLSCVLVVGCFTASAAAVVSSELDVVNVIARATGQFKETIPANTVLHLGDSISLDKGETVSYDCSYTPRDANVQFGYIGVDGLFYGLSGYKGSIDKGIRVNQRGSYTLAIVNDSDEAVTVWGTVNY